MLPYIHDFECQAMDSSDDLVIMVWNLLREAVFMRPWSFASIASVTVLRLRTCVCV